MRKLFTAILLLILYSINGQKIKVLQPELGSENRYSPSESEYWRKAIDSLKISNDYTNNINYTNLSESTRKAIDSLENGGGPLTDGIGCSWYCGGGPYKITSSSVLGNNIKYSEQNIHDFDLLTAWVPKAVNGVGESISFHFKSKSPRINAIIIYNGYIKNYELWKNNARAKKINLKINNITIAVLELMDTTASQRFDIKPIQSKIKNKDLIITLEIIDFYKGDKHTDLVISEVNFDGLDVH